MKHKDILSDEGKYVGRRLLVRVCQEGIVIGKRMKVDTGRWRRDKVKQDL